MNVAPARQFGCTVAEKFALLANAMAGARNNQSLRRVWARGMLVAALTLALLFAPCLSVFGLFGFGGAHAHHAAQQVGDFGAHDHAQHDHATRHHHAGASQPEGQADRTPERCCRLCDGWTVKKFQIDQPALDSAWRSGGPDGAKPAIAAHIDDVATPHPDRTPAPGPHRQRAGAGSVPLYALTARYRL